MKIKQIQLISTPNDDCKFISNVKDCVSFFHKESIAKTNPCCESGEIVKSKKVIVLRGESYESIQPQNYIITRRMKAFASLAYRSSGFRFAI